VDHQLAGLSDPCQIWELSQSQTIINSYIPGNQCITIAYPNCNEGNEVLISNYYIAGRTCSGQIVPATPSNFYQISSIILGSAGINTLSGIEAEDNAAASSGGWCVFLIHAMDSENGYSPISHTLFQQSIQYLAAHRSTFWVGTFLNVVKYIKERNDVSVSETSNTGDSITLAVTDTLNNAIYNYPVTIRRPLPTGWPFADVSQNGQAVDAYIVDVNSVKYVMFDVVPNGGNVVLSKGLYGDFTGNGIVEMNDLPTFFNYWLVNDCNEFTMGVDLDENCIVNFYEFAVLAQNWLQTP
jgi:oligosaccharide reducing-end xylanase